MRQEQGGSAKTPVWLSLCAAETAARVTAFVGGHQKLGPVCPESQRFPPPTPAAELGAHSLPGLLLESVSPGGPQTVLEVYPQVCTGLFAAPTPSCPPPPAFGVSQAPKLGGQGQ